MVPAKWQDITADWLTEALNASGATGKARVTSVTLTPMGVGEGFVSDMVRLVPTYDHPGPTPPATMVAKMPVSYGPALEVARLFRLYDREIRFYSPVAPGSPIRVPRALYPASEPEMERYILIMEDCAHCRPGNQVRA